jgi:hypothetical protein
LVFLRLHADGHHDIMHPRPGRTAWLLAKPVCASDTGSGARAGDDGDADAGAAASLNRATFSMRWQLFGGCTKGSRGNNGCSAVAATILM